MFGLPSSPNGSLILALPSRDFAPVSLPARDERNTTTLTLRMRIGNQAESQSQIAFQFPTLTLPHRRSTRIGTGLTHLRRTSRHI
ncbi:hypothetical protein BLNAU_24239 [Blattamonas nauphoetae]|uniref:Uncharacterized protein n=1 Tax=Blattamonas nauphoetae TaxID=2049346 RepID=A0ABQ9WN02_9EUKA|nr:hypothetical protein BLNAU_24239 [Blattamonas nauphoetae]